MPATETIIDGDLIGKKGYPMHYVALGLEPPTKTVPVEDGIPQTEHPGMTLAEYAAWAEPSGMAGLFFPTVKAKARSLPKLLQSKKASAPTAIRGSLPTVSFAS